MEIKKATKHIHLHSSKSGLWIRLMVFSLLSLHLGKPSDRDSARIQVVSGVWGEEASTQEEVSLPDQTSHSGNVG